jgi:hypothetical protein
MKSEIKKNMKHEQAQLGIIKQTLQQEKLQINTHIESWSQTCDAHFSQHCEGKWRDFVRQGQDSFNNIEVRGLFLSFWS